MPFHGKRKHGGRADWLNTLGIVLGIGLWFVPIILFIAAGGK